MGKRNPPLSDLGFSTVGNLPPPHLFFFACHDILDETVPLPPHFKKQSYVSAVYSIIIHFENNNKNNLSIVDVLPAFLT